jgi:two-component system, NtrC family, nitrogen regulation response regulator NtrX
VIDDLLASYVSLPLRNLVPPSSKLRRTCDVASLRCVAQILVIEDDRDIGNLIRQVLSDEGYDLTFVDGLDRAPVDAVPDVVITDLVGVRPYASDLARAWVRRVQDRYPHTPVIVCTAQELALKELDGLGAAAVLPKPFAIDLLVQTVARLVDQ